MGTEGDGRGGSGGAAWVGLGAAGLALGGVLVSLAGDRFGAPLLEDVLGPAITVLGAVVWVGSRATRGRRR